MDITSKTTRTRTEWALRYDDGVTVNMATERQARSIAGNGLNDDAVLIHRTVTTTTTATDWEKA